MPGSTGSQSGTSWEASTSRHSSGVEKVARPGQEDDVLDDRAFTHGAMGVMYTVCKEKAQYGPLFIAFRLLADWLQLWLLVVQPPQFDLPPDKLWWQIINFIGLNQFMTGRGYTFFLACFYLLVCGLLLSVGLSVWVGWSFQQNRFDHVWPIIILRWFAKIFYQMLDIMSMSLFLMTLDCQLFYRPDAVIGYNQEFPDIYCWGMPHLIHVVVAILSLVLFLFLAAAFTVGEMELEFTTHNQLAIMHTGVELWTFIIRVLMTFVSVLVYNPKWASVAQLFLSCWLVGLVLYWQLQLEGWVNHVRVGMYTSVAWCSVLYVISAFNLGWDGSDPDASHKSIHTLTIVMWATTIPMGALGAWTSWLRLHQFETTVLDKFKRDLPEDLVDADEVYEFSDSRFAEVLARCCRVWVSKRVLEPKGVLLAEKVMQVGLTQMPKDPFMLILYSSFLMDVQNSYQSGYSQLQAAKKLELSFLMRFAIFSREQQHAQRSAAGSGNRAADLVSYVEFQRNYSLALKVHRETLVNMQRFWECLMHKTVKFRTLSDTVKAMDSSIRQAERVYKSVLQRHASNVKIVRLYAKFLEQVKQDPWAAARWFSEAERLEAAEDESRQYDTLGGLEIEDPVLRAALVNAGPTGATGMHADGRAVIILNANSIITLANPACVSLLGFTKAELINKHLRLILPPNIAEAHTTFVRNYIQTGRSIILGRTVQQVAVHKDKCMVPIYLSVSKISGIGEDSMFMGVMERIPVQPDIATVWLMMDGTILALSAAFTDWFGWNAKDVQGQSMYNLAASGAKDLQDALRHARTAVAEAHAKTMLNEPLLPSKTNHRASFMASSTGLAKKHDSITTDKSMFVPEVDSDNLLGKGKVVPDSPFLHSSKSVIGTQKSDLGAERNRFLLDKGSTGQQQDKGHIGFDKHLFDNELLALGDSELGLGHGKPSMSDNKSNIGDTAKLSLGDDAVILLQSAVHEWGLRLGVAHKFAMPTNCDVTVTNGGAGAFCFHVLSVKRNATSGPLVRQRTQGGSYSMSGAMMLPSQTSVTQTMPTQDLMAVLNTKGQLVHVTSALANMLGRSAQSAVANYGLSAFEQLMAKPFGALHKSLIQGVQPLSIPPYSCRSGLSVLLQGQGPQGQPLLHPAKLNMSKKMVADETLHVVLMQARTMDQALAERRLLLELDGHGVVTKVDADTPASLFGCEPDKLLGKHACSFLDVLRPTEAAPCAELDLIDQQHSLTVLLEMAAPAIQNASSSWRVGFIAPETALPGEGDNMATAKVKCMLASRPKPTVMRLRVRFGAGLEDSDKPPSVTIEMELWRADLCASVIEVDQSGIIHPPEFSEVAELYPPDLVLGTSPDFMVDQHVSTYLAALAKQPLSELMNPHFGSRVALRRTDSKKSAMKVPVTAPAAAPVPAGPAHVLNTVHYEDKSDLQVSVQAIRRSITPGVPAGFYLIIRPIKPTISRPGLQDWIMQQELAEKVPKQRRASVLALKHHSSVQAPVQPISSPRPPSSNRPVSAFRPMSGTSYAAALRAVSERPDDEDGEQDDEQQQELDVPALGIKTDMDSDEAHVLMGGDVRNSTGSNGVLQVKDRERIKSWLQAQAGSPFGMAGEPEPSSDTKKVSLELPAAMPKREGVALVMMDTNAPAIMGDGPSEECQMQVPDEANEQDGEMDEADYKRGQRFKKLHAVLSSQIVQHATSNYKKWALANVAVLCLAQLAAFITMSTLLQQQKVMVADLTYIGRGGNRAAEIALYTKSITIIYSNVTVPTLDLVSGPDDLPYLKKIYRQAIDEFMAYHQGAYLGYDTPRSLPDVLKPIWEDPSVIITTADPIYANVSAGNNTLLYLSQVNQTTNLWKAGQRLAEKAASYYENSDAYNASIADKMQSDMNPDAFWIVTNAPQAVFPGYLDTLDAYLQLTLDFTDSINQVQLILLAIEGVVVCAALSIWSWMLLQRVACQRFRVYQVFMVVPLTLLRRLATKQYLLGDEEEDETDPKDRPDANTTGLNGMAATTMTTQQQPASKTQAAAPDSSKIKAATTKMNIHVKTAAAATADANGHNANSLAGWWLALLSCCGAARKGPNGPESKRQLLPCTRTSMWLVWPFLLWGLTVIICYSLGFMLLQSTSGPIAMFNMVNYVNMLYNRNSFYLQELVYEQDYNVLQQAKAQAVLDIQLFAKEYDVLMYGSKVVPDETDPHYTLLVHGLAESPIASDILFHTTDCLCLNASDCQEQGTGLYQDTHQGLDRLVLKYIEVGGHLDKLQYMDPRLYSPEYYWLWSTRWDMKGGFRRLTDQYQAFVDQNIQSVEVLHIIVLVLTLVLVAAYLLLMFRPFLRVTTYEIRRIAELLSQLPPEVDVVGVVQTTLVPVNPEADVMDDKPAANAGAASTDNTRNKSINGA